MELAIGIIGLLVAVLLWFFPPWPLRQLLGVRESDPTDASTGTRRKRVLTNAFRASIEKLDIVDDDQYFRHRASSLMHVESRPRIIERSRRESLLRWIESLDDELLLVTLEIREYWRGKDWREGVPRPFLVKVAQPLGNGRSVPDLEKELIDTGVLAPGEDQSWFAYGPNLQKALDYIDLVDWNELKRSIAVGERYKELCSEDPN